METQVVAEVLKALTITGPIGIMLGFAVLKLWSALVEERQFSRDLHGQTIRVIGENTSATQQHTAMQQQHMRAIERLESTVDELRRGITGSRQH